MKVITEYQCEVCQVRYLVQELAKACEKHVPAPLAVKIGQEVKLKNRNTGYTLAVVKELSLVARHALYGNTSSEIISKWPEGYLDTIEFHTWELELDRRVILDHHWETATQYIDCLYLLSEEDAKDLVQDDNNCY